MWSCLRALPSYLGGKRKLLGYIFKHLPKPAEASVFVDAFLGGGSVSLYAKARGYRVISNDIAKRSYVVGKALIENSRVRLNDSDIVRLFTDGDGDDFVTSNFAPDVIPRKHAEFLDNALAVIRDIAGIKRWLLLLLVIKYVLRLRPMGNFGAKTIMHQIENGDWEQMNPKYVKQIVSRNICGHPKRILERLMGEINGGVFDNNRSNVTYNKDILEFLGEVGGDILYLDPPYAGTTSYEQALKPLDSILEGKLVDIKPSVFSRKDAVANLERLFDRSRRFPIWVISYGNAQIGIEELKSLVGKFKRNVRAEEFEYAHLASLSGEASKENNREYLIIARGDR